MKNKPLSEVEQAVETYVTRDCDKAYHVVCTGEQTRDGNWKCDGWKFSFGAVSFEYFTGTGHRQTVRGFAATKYPGAKHVRGHWEANIAQVPPVAGLLHSIVLDASASQQSFADWCADFGYDTDSRSALATYHACQENGDKLRNVFTGAQIAHIATLLQDY